METVVLGASPNPRRYSYLATIGLIDAGFKVIPVGIKDGIINNVKISKQYPENKNIHTLAMYLSEKNQKAYYDILTKNPPERLIFNPGTYNNELESIMTEKGVKVIRSCVLVMLSHGVYEQ